MTSTLLTAALEYADDGWPVFPCKQDKTPLTGHGVLEATTDRDTITKWWTEHPGANIGMHCGAANILVIDHDVGADLGMLRKLVGDLAVTNTTSSTPSGGWHDFYQIPMNADGSYPSIPNSASKLAHSVDVRSFHGYVLLPPSRTPAGEYTWVRHNNMAEASPGLMAACVAGREKDDRANTWEIDPDQPIHVDQAIEWLKDKAKIAVEGQGGDHIAYSTGAMCKSFGLTADTAKEIMWEHWNPRCIPPWVASDYDHFTSKIDHAYTYNTSPPGNCTDQWQKQEKAKLFRKVERTLPSGRETRVGRFRFVDRDGMGHVVPPEWLVENLIQSDTYSMLFGAHGTYKTFIAIDLACSIATGKNTFLGGNWEIKQPGAVLLSVGEGRGQIVNRIEAWEQHNGMRATNLVLADPVLGLGDDMETFWAGAKDLLPKGFDHYDLAIIDTVGRSMQGVNENQQDNASKFTALVEHMRAELGCAVLALHHTGHEAGDRARGSSVFGADTDTMVRLDKEGTSNVTMTMTKQKDAPEWTKPRHLAVESVQLPSDVTSLVVVEAPAPLQEPKADPVALEKAARKHLDGVVCGLLKEYYPRRWSQADLAVAVASLPSIHEKSETLRQETLKTLREDKSTKAHHCFDAFLSQNIGKWGWVK